MKTKENKLIVYAKNRKEWRKWLEKNHDSETVVWLTIYHKDADTKSVYYTDAVEEALCFGWIDSRADKNDENSFLLSFYPRKPKSNWSKPNRERAARMIEQGLMAPAGLAMINLAKETGTWDAMKHIEDNVIPEDLQQLFDKNKTAYNNYMTFAPSSQRLILKWIHDAKRTETRQKRIEETVRLAEQNIKANHPK